MMPFFIGLRPYRQDAVNSLNTHMVYRTGSQKNRVFKLFMDMGWVDLKS